MDEELRREVEVWEGQGLNRAKTMAVVIKSDPSTGAPPSEQSYMATT